MSMKTLFFLLLFTSCTIYIPNKAGAQYKKGDLYGQANIGLLTYYQFADGIINLSGGRIPEYYESSIPAISFTMKYLLKPKLGLGLTACYQEIYGYSNDYFANYMGASAGYYRFTEHYYTVTTDATFIIDSWKNTQFYLLIGAGVTYVYRDYEQLQNFRYTNITWKSQIYPTGQITPIGFKFGDNFAPFLEFGIGYKGLICGGFTFKLARIRKQPIKSMDKLPLKASNK